MTFFAIWNGEFSDFQELEDVVNVFMSLVCIICAALGIVLIFLLCFCFSKMSCFDNSCWFDNGTDVIRCDQS